MSGEERSKRKYIKQQPAPDNPSNGKKAKKFKKPWLIEQRFTGAPKGSIWNKLYSKEKGWVRCRVYRKEAGANEAVKSIKCNHWHEYFEFRVRNREFKSAE